MVSSLAACRVCRTPAIARRVDFGPQPICNRFLTAADAPEDRFPLSVAQCEACGVLQLEALAPPDALRPRHPWITYREAEAHLDQMVRDVIATSGAGRDALILGASYKDASTLDRLRRLGHTRVVQLQPREHLGVDRDRAEIETVQDRLTEDRARAIAEREGQADLLIMRHVIEHTHDIHAFARAVRALVKPGGCALFEVPDFAPSLRAFDYSTLWEEHVYCFTPATLPATCERLGFEVLRVENYAYPIENALVVIVRVASAASHAARARVNLDAECAAGRAYGDQHPVLSARLQAFLADFRRTRGPVAVFGAGHLTCKYINLMGLAPHLAFVADGDPNKIGLFMPGSRLPIVHPSALQEQGVRLCLLGLSAESEARIRDAFKPYTDAGGQFASISPISPTHLVF